MPKRFLIKRKEEQQLNMKQSRRKIISQHSYLAKKCGSTFAHTKRSDSLKASNEQIDYVAIRSALQ